MRRLLYLAALSMVMGLVFVSVALAQVPPSEGGTCPEGYILYEGPGTASGQCVPSDRGVNPPAADAAQYQQPVPASTPPPASTPLPATGGPALLAPAGLLLLGAGLIGLRMVRRS
jgi:hypothetical protein